MMDSEINARRLKFASGHNRTHAAQQTRLSGRSVGALPTLTFMALTRRWRCVKQYDAKVACKTKLIRSTILTDFPGRNVSCSQTIERIIINTRDSGSGFRGDE